VKQMKADTMDSFRFGLRIFLGSVLEHREGLYYSERKAAGEVAGTASLVSTCCVYSSHGQSRGRQLVLVGSNPAAANPLCSGQ